MLPIPGMPAAAFISLAAGSFLVGLIVVRVVFSPSLRYSGRIAILIFGMILGNSMNGVGLAMDRLNTEVPSRAPKIEALLAFGATPWEGIQDSMRQAVRAGMIPTINSLIIVGPVSLPGMMTGQILGGADPVQAVQYQSVF